MGVSSQTQMFWGREELLTPWKLPCDLFPFCTGQLKVSNLVTSLREIAHADSQMAYHLWVLVFPIVWATLAEKKDQQVQLAKPIIQLLSKEHHGKQTHHRPNVVQVVALVFACTGCCPCF